MIISFLILAVGFIAAIIGAGGLCINHYRWETDPGKRTIGHMHDVDRSYAFAMFAGFIIIGIGLLLSCRYES